MIVQYVQIHAIILGENYVFTSSVRVSSKVFSKADPAIYHHTIMPRDYGIEEALRRSGC